MDLLYQAVALMIVGMAIVFSMLIALIGVISLNARVVRLLNLDKPVPAPAAAGRHDGKPIAAIIAAAIQAHEDFNNTPSP